MRFLEHEMDWKTASRIGATKQPEDHARDHRADELDYSIFYSVHVNDHDLRGLGVTASVGSKTAKACKEWSCVLRRTGRGLP